MLAVSGSVQPLNGPHILLHPQAEDRTLLTPTAACDALALKLCSVASHLQDYLVSGLLAQHTLANHVQRSMRYTCNRTFGCWDLLGF